MSVILLEVVEGAVMVVFEVGAFGGDVCELIGCTWLFLEWSSGGSSLAMFPGQGS